MDCEGTVTDVNPALCFFNIHEKRIHLSLLIANNDKIGLPILGSSVTVKNVCRKETSCIVTNESVLTGDFSNHPLPEFLHLIQSLDLTCDNIIMLDRALNLLNRNFHKISNDIKNELVISLCKHLFNQREDNTNKIFTSISNCRYVELKRNYEGFPYWSHGVHPKVPANSLLLGYLTVQPMYGVLVLTDSNHGMACIVCNISVKDVLPVIDSYVLISNYEVVTEIYKDCDNFEYILVKLEDVVPLHRPQDFIMPVLSEFDVIEERNYKNCLQFELIGKSEVCLSSQRTPVCWLKIRITGFNEVDQDNVAYLLLPREFIKLVIHLKLYHCYKLFYNLELKGIGNIELTRLTSCNMFELVDKSARFQHLGKRVTGDNDDSDILSVEECRTYLKTNTESVSLEGIIHNRRFNEPLSSRTKNNATVGGFGLPGRKSTQIVFLWLEGGKKQFLDWYLNNWENTLMPLGLIAGMKIIVRNVLPQSKKYLKSCLFTSIEIVSYEPAVHFRTVNLYQENYLGWGPKFFFGAGWHIPQGVLISGIVLSIKILGVKIRYTCKYCKQKIMNEADGICASCGKKEAVMDFLLTMYITDQYAESKVIVKDVNFLRFILHMQKKPFEEWVVALNKIGQYTYSVQGDEDIVNKTNTQHNLFRETLSMYFENFNMQEIMRLHLMCRKLDSDPQKNEGRSLWFYIDAQYCN